jgi:HPt (histidine-containing phosphotransfer) domain-containing protein
MAESTPAPNSTAIRSNLLHDADMTELIEMFVQEMPARITGLTETLARSEYTDLKRIAHQLKGACGGYGFPDVGAAAARVETTLLRSSPGKGEISLTSLKQQVDELVDLCRRVSV